MQSDSLRSSTPRLSNALRAAMVLGAGYFVVGSLWILLSDAMVESVSSDPGWLTLAQRYKGLAYILLTTLGLVYLVQLGYQRLFRMQERVRNSDLRVNDLFMNHPRPMWVFDLADWRFLRVNDAAVAAYGFGREEFLAMSACDIRPPEDVPAFMAAAMQRRTTGSAGVFRHRRKDGSVFLARITQHEVELNGRAAMMAMAEDVTEEVRLHDAVERQQRQFQQLHESLGEVLWISTPDGSKVLYVSPAFATVYGRRPDELLANPQLWREAVHPDDVAQVKDFGSLQAGTDHVESEYRIRWPDGGTRWIKDRKRVIRDENGVPTMIGGIAEDITAWKERDEARSTLAHRLEGLVAERTRELAQANIELEAFSRTAAHDLKTPLNGIVGLSQLLRMKSSERLDEAGRRYLDQIERSARDMARLINDLLALSRSGSTELHREWVDLAPVARELFDELRLLEPLRSVEVTMPERLQVHGDAGLLRSVVHNLCGNAWKFSAHRDVARIALAVEQRGGRTVLSVRDNGAGFDTRGLGELLRPFQRFHTQAQFQGTGLGLVTCQRIAQRHGGRLLIESRPEAGTCVSVELPLPGRAAAAPSEAPAADAGMTGLQPAHHLPSLALSDFE